MAWDKTKPAGSTKLRDADDQIRANNDAIDDVIGTMLGVGDPITATADELNQLASVEVGGNTSGDVVTTDDTQDLTNKTYEGASVGGASSGDIATTDDTQTLTNKTIDANNNVVANLAHGAEVNNPSSGVHGATGSIVGTSDTQTLTNKTINGNNNTISNLAHGSEVDSPASGVHGVSGSVVGTGNTQTLTNKTLTSPTITTPSITTPAINGQSVSSVGGEIDLACENIVNAFVCTSHWTPTAVSYFDVPLSAGYYKFEFDLVPTHPTAYIQGRFNGLNNYYSATIYLMGVSPINWDRSFGYGRIWVDHNNVGEAIIRWQSYFGTGYTSASNNNGASVFDSLGAAVTYLRWSISSGTMTGNFYVWKLR